MWELRIGEEPLHQVSTGDCEAPHLMCPLHVRLVLQWPLKKGPCASPCPGDSGCKANETSIPLTPV